MLLSTAQVRLAHAAIESELVQRGIQAYNDLEYANAIDLLHQALHETLTREEKLATLSTLAFAHVALQQPIDARGDFEALLRIDPRYELDRTITPRVRAVFEEAQARVATGSDGNGGIGAGGGLPALKPHLGFSGGGAHPKVGLPVAVSVRYPGGVAADGQLFFRTRGASIYSMINAPFDGSGRFEAVVPGSNVAAPALEYYVVALDSSGVAIAVAGSMSQPLAEEILVPKKPLYAKGWFWGVVIGGAAVVAGVATGIAVGTRSSVAPGTAATVTLNPSALRLHF